MTTRREFLKVSAIAAAGISTFGFNTAPYLQQSAYETKRPALQNRKFISESVEAKIAEIKKNINDEELGWLFENCFPNTLDTTVSFAVENGKPDTFVITGDINAMWLRDSSAQVWPYVPLTKDDKKLRALIAGVINRQAKCILIDPYANAFNKGKEGSEFDSDHTIMKPELHERKWEIDSLCYPIRLAYGYWKTTGDASCFDAQWAEAMALVVKTFKEQQRINNPGPYSFQRNTSTWTDTLPQNGYGMPTKKIGLIHSMFRPSDDSCIYPFLIPSNLFAAVSLNQLSEIFSTELKNKEFANECSSLAAQLTETIEKYAVTEHLNYGKMYAFEIDGYGNMLFNDDANVPNLLSLPYLGCCKKDDAIYRNTRKFVLSSDNPYFYVGKYGEGLGGMHTEYNYIWPLGIIMRGLTSDDNGEIYNCIKTLKNTHAGSGFMHESFSKDDPAKFTRNWFAWANTLFGELIFKLNAEKREILKQTF
jgi:uncharacterized protein